MWVGNKQGLDSTLEGTGHAALPGLAMCQACPRHGRCPEVEQTEGTETPAGRGLCSLLALQTMWPSTACRSRGSGGPSGAALPVQLSLRGGLGRGPVPSHADDGSSLHTRCVTAGEPLVLSGPWPPPGGLSLLWPLLPQFKVQTHSGHTGHLAR